MSLLVTTDAPRDTRDTLATTTDAELVYVVLDGLNCARHGTSDSKRKQLDDLAVAVDVALERFAPEAFADGRALLAEDSTE